MTTVPTATPATTFTAAQRAILEMRLRGAATGTVVTQRPTGVRTPLTPAQHSVWLVNQFVPDNSVYGMYEAVRLTGRLDVAALRSALRNLMARHEILRTVFREDANGPHQVVLPLCEPAFRFVEASDDEDARQLLANEVATGFDLGEGPLLRALLVAIRPEEHLLLLHLHHLIGDEWSTGVMIDELSASYRAGDPGPVRLQYGDYAWWAAQQNTAVPADLAYWREALDGIQDLQLPVDRLRPSAATLRGDTVRALMPASVIDALNDLARREDTTPFVAVLTAYAAVLARFSGQERFVVGTLTAGRGRAELESMVGLFANTATIPMDLRDDPTVDELLRRARVATLAMLDHQLVSFDQVVSELRPDRDRSRNPIFQVMFQYLADTTARWDLAGLAAEPVDVEVRGEKVDLTLSARPATTGLELELRYATDLFHAETAQGLLASVQEVITSLVTARTDTRLHEVAPVLTHPATAGVGKVDREASPALEPPTKTVLSRPHTPTEKALAQIWQEVLRTPRVGIHDNFYDLGGDSILAIRIVNEARKVGIPLTSRHVYRHNTIAEQAAVVAPDEAATSARATVPANHFPSAGLDPDDLARALAQLSGERIDDIYRLSPLQEGMLLELVTNPDAGRYVQWHVYDIESDVDTQALAAAWRLVIEWHPALRTRVLWDGLPHAVQVVVAQEEVVLEQPGVNLGALIAADPPIDPARGFQRFLLIQRDGGGFRFAWRTHHVLLDGMSAETVLREVFACYEELRAGRPVPVAADRVAFADYIAWLGQRDAATDAAHWRHVFDGYAGQAGLSLLERTGERGIGVLAHDLVDGHALRAAARTHRITPAALLHAAWALVLGRHLGSGDVTMGTTLTGRSGGLPGIESVIGMLMNTLPLRIRLDPGGRVEDLLRDVQMDLADLYDHTYSALSDIKRAAGLPTHRPLFDTIMVVNNGAPGHIADGVRAVEEDRAVDTGYVLVVDVTIGARVDVRIAYDKAQIRPDSVRRIHKSFSAAVTALLAGSATRVRDLQASPLPARKELKESLARTLPADVMPAAPSTPDEKALAHIWQDILRIATVGIHDNFYDLGGDSILAIRMVARCRQIGLALKPSEVLRHATIAEILEHFGSAPADASTATSSSTSASSTYAEPEAAEERYPLTPSQLGMLRQRQADPEHDEYLRQYAWDITGPLRVDLFTSAWQLAVERHAALRTRFEATSGQEPVQVAVAHVPVVFERWDSRDVPDDEFDEWWARLLKEESRLAVDPLSAPPHRLVLVRTGTHAHRFLWTTHHLVIDGWSLGIVLQEVLDAYAALEAGQRPHLDRPVPFRDYVTWLDRQPAEWDADFWRNELAGATMTPIPLRPTADNGIGYAETALSNELARGVRETARAVRTTASTVLQVAWGLALSAWSGRDDVLFGTTVSGRTADVPGIERMVGMLINTMPTRVRLDTDTSVGPWLAEQTSRDIERQEHSATALTDIRGYAGLATGGRLFESLFVLENAEGGEPGVAGGIRLSGIDTTPGGTGYPLVLTPRLAERIEIGLKYEAALFDSEDAAELLADYVRVLEALVRADSGDPIGNLRASIKSATTLRLAVQSPPRQRQDGPDWARHARLLAEIWKEVLGVAEVGPADSYTGLGGNSILAFQVTARGRQEGLPITVHHVLAHDILGDLARSMTAPAIELAEPDAEASVSGQIPLVPAQAELLRRLGPIAHYNQSQRLRCVDSVDADALRSALRSVVAHHDALRLRLVRTDDGWTQSIAATDEHDFLMLSGDPHRTLDPEDGPLLRARLDGDDVLVAVHHLAVDTLSWGVLLADLATAYAAIMAGDEVRLPQRTTSFAYWARRLHGFAESPTVVEQIPFWQAQAARPDEIPAEHPQAPDDESSSRVTEITFPAELTKVVLSRPVVPVLIAALARTLTGWTGTDAVTVELETSGRDPLFDEVDLARTVGWFTAAYPVRLGGDASADLAAELIRMAGPGLGYGLSPEAGAQVPAQVGFTFHGVMDGAVSTADKDVFTIVDDDSVARDPRAPRRHAIEVSAWIRDGQMHVSWTTSGRHDDATRHKLAQAYVHEVAVVSGERTRQREFQRRLVRGAPALAAIQARHRIPGVSIAILAGGEITDAWGTGLTRIGGEPIGSRTPFQACSISKHVTTFGVLRLVADGVLGLDSDIREHLRGWTLERPVTLRGLLSHRAGLTVFGHPGYDRSGPTPSLDQILYGQPPVVTPRIAVEHAARFAYSCSNFTVVQKLLADVTGEDFAKLMHRLVLAPLGMADSGFDAGFPLRRGVAQGHDAFGVQVRGGWHAFPEQAASGLWTTPADLVLLAQAIRASVWGDGQLAPELARSMLSSPDAAGYGFGTLVREHDGELWFGHPGDRDTFQCVTLTGLHSGDGLVVMANGGGGDSAFLTDLLAEIGFPFPPALT